MSTTTATNGYTIRLELLKMAKEMLEQNWHAQRDMVMQDYNNRVSFVHAQVEKSGPKAMAEYPTIPTIMAFPTEAEIISKATALNQFISAK
jgi:hypothetical protein